MPIYSTSYSGRCSGRGVPSGATIALAQVFCYGIALSSITMPLLTYEKKPQSSTVVLSEIMFDLRYHRLTQELEKLYSAVELLYEK